LRAVKVENGEEIRFRVDFYRYCGQKMRGEKFFGFRDGKA